MILRGDALRVPLRRNSVHLVVCSPPFFALRSYRDGGVHFEGQIGAEPHPQLWLEAMWAVTRRLWEVLVDTGSVFIEIGDKRSGSGGHNNAGLAGKTIPPPPGVEFSSNGQHGPHGSRSRPATSGSAVGSTLEGRLQEVSNAPGRAQRRQKDIVRSTVGDPSMRASRATRRNAPDRYQQAAFGRAKSKMLLPHRFAIGCEDGLADPCVVHGDEEHPWGPECLGMGWIVRQDNVWTRPNGLPESVDDRTRDTHSYVFHLTKQGGYYSAIDEIREPSSGVGGLAGSFARPRPSHDLLPGQSAAQHHPDRDGNGHHALGRLPGSVWTLPTEPLSTPDYFVVMPEGGDAALWDSRPTKPKGEGGLFDEPHLRLVADPPWVEPMRWLAAEVTRRHAEGLAQPTVLEIDHFAAFPTELVRRVILGWSPPAICTACGEGRFPVVDKSQTVERQRNSAKPHRQDIGGARSNGHNAEGYPVTTSSTSIVGYACACTPRTVHDDRRRSTSTPKREDLTHRPADGYGSNTLPPPGPPVVEYHLEGWTPPPSRPAVVLDPFSGTGTTAMVARALGRVGVGLDLSADYCRLARWRVHESGQGAKVVRRTNTERQGAMAL